MRLWVLNYRGYCGARLAIKKPTIDDVAAHAKVGRTTVSRVLNNSPAVKDEVRQRVLDSVAALNYKVNMQARSLASNSSNNIAIVHASDFDSEPNSYYQSGLELGALRACSDLGYSMQTHTINQNNDEFFSKILQVISDNNYDGVILTPPFSDNFELVSEICNRKLPLVCISAGKQTRKIAPSIGIDDECAGYDLAKYLLSLGHKYFGYIRGLKGHISAEDRYDGFVRALKEFDIDPSTAIVERGNFTFKSGIEIAQLIFSKPNRPSALICANDDMAAGALLSAHKMGLNIPQDISIVGFDDTPVSEIVWPPLTTIHQPLKKLGRGAVELLIDCINNTPTAQRHDMKFIPFTLQVRESTAVFN